MTAMRCDYYESVTCLKASTRLDKENAEEVAVKGDGRGIEDENEI